ncbi:MAG: S8 family serine peptidase [Dokdonella sp.]|uniref:S8 family serine peptidase n=1 Tax=Dokdonella sp. TaxID=2291710 RepID=UPI00326648B6
MKSVRNTALTTAVGIALFGITASTGISAAGITAAQSTSSVLRASTTGRYIVTFAEAGLVDYKGGVAGLARTAPEADLVSANSSRKLDANSSAAASYKSYLATQRAQYIGDIQQALGRNLAIRYTYDVTRNAISVSLSPSEAAAVARMPGVVSVEGVQVKQMDTFRGPTFIGANTIWDGTAVPSYAAATRGQGVKVGIIDSGANSTHPSFANDATCGFSEAAPKLFPKDCMTNNGTSCTGTTPDADQGNGHGVHTGSTAAGNTIDNTVTPAPLLPDGITMSGVAPCAAVYTYKVCDSSGCTDDAITAGIQNAIADQVDVINFSIGPTCGGGDPWVDSLDFLAAQGADVFVAASAGNTRSNCTDPTGLVANNGPWETTVAASTQDQLISPQLTVTGPGTPPALTQNITLNPGNSTLTPAETTDLLGQKLRTDPANITGCTASGGFAPGYFAGSVAIIQRGTCTFSEKITNAYNSGAYVVVITNNQAGVINMDTSTLPTAISDVVAAFSTTQVQGDALIAFVNANLGPIPDADAVFADGFELPEGALGDYNRAAIGLVQGDVLAGFSFRGPTVAPYDDLTKPDITGPGVSIFAALTTEEGSYGLLSGTSMSSPHLAGSAALVRAVQPTWTPMEVKSAIQMTATLTGFQEDGVTQWGVDEVGSGRVDLTKATLAGLTLDETNARFHAADPAASTVAIKDLNIASVRNVNCDIGCNWTRTFKNQLHASGTWTPTAIDPAGYHLTFSPATFTLAQGATQALTITATATAGSTSDLSYGRIDLTESGGQSPVEHLTVAVKGGTAPPAPGVCEGGTCNLTVDGLPAGGSFNALGCGPAAPCQFLWLNQFKPEAAEYPITLNTVDTIFGTQTTVGDVFDVYVYQDNDDSPANGATLVASVTGQTITALSTFQTISIPGGAVLSGPGDILIALVNRTVNAYPGSADNAVPFANQSYISALGSVPATPVLATLNMQPTTAVLASFTHNWIIRGHGTNGGGRPITLAPVQK